MFSVSTRRMYRRIRTDYRGFLFMQDSTQTIVIRDLSLNGLRIEGCFPPPRGILVAVRFWLPDGEILEIDQALVRWSNGTHCGVQVVSLSNEADFRLARHIEERITQSGQAEKERRIEAKECRA